MSAFLFGPPSLKPLPKNQSAYESSCFSGRYVTGETIDDEYFAKLHDARNDEAKLRRLESDGAGGKLPPGSHDGCENLSNDKRGRATAAS